MKQRIGIDPARMAEPADDFEVEAFLNVTRRLRNKARRKKRR